jgi:DNA-binding NarL/FixJ family response regulator
VSRAGSRAITVVVGRFESLVASGLENVLDRDRHIRVLITDLEDAELERFVVDSAPQVAIVSEAVRYALLSRLKVCQPATGVVVVAPDPGRLWGEVLVEVGATCLAQNAAQGDILAAVRLAADGEPSYLPAGGGGAARIAPGQGPLTNRQCEVFERLSEGRTNREIADALHISARTVGTHVSMIFRKLGVHSRQELLGMRLPSGK